MTYATDNTGKRKSAFTVYLSHRLTGKVIVKNDVKVQPPLADMLQPPMADGQHVNNVNICQHSPVTKVENKQAFTPMGEIETIKHLQRFTLVIDISKDFNTLQQNARAREGTLTGALISQRYETIDQSSHPQFEDMLKAVTCFDIGISRNQTLAFLSNFKGSMFYRFGKHQSQSITFDNNLLRNFRSGFTPLGKKSHLYKTQKMIAKKRLNNYPSCALSKISKLVLADYSSLGVQSVRAFFVRNTPMRPHIYVELWRDTFECASDLVSLSANPLQLRTNNYLAVISEAPVTLGVHTHVY